MENSTNLIGIGLMSGSSLDGLDVVISEFFMQNSEYQVKILRGKTYNYSSPLKNRLENAPHMSNEEITKLDVDFGVFSGEAVIDFLKQINVKPNFIGSHGHTVWHQPEKKITKQIGSGAVINALTGITTVCDFRQQDVFLGGQGAPMVPAAEVLLFPDVEAFLNLGGIANITIKQPNRVVGFDVAPANQVLNALAKLLGHDYDPEGSLAREGKFNSEVFAKLDQWPYYNLPAPKSLDRRQIRPFFEPIVMSVPPRDSLRTFTAHLAHKLYQTVAGAPVRPKKLMVTGGGAYNKTLVDSLTDLLAPQTELIIPEPEWIDFKEAVCFAFFAYLRLMGKPNTLISVTGASRAVSAGAIYG